MTFFKLISILNLLLVIHLTHAEQLKFSELYATDLKGNNVSFSKYENHLVYFYQMHPILKKPGQQIKFLNAIYDEYHERGVDIVVFSSKHVLGRLFNRLFFRYKPHFDMYEHKYAHKIDEFLSIQPLTKMTSKHLFLVLQNGKTFYSTLFHHPLGDKREAYQLKGIKWDIEHYLNRTKTEKSPQN